MTERLEDCEEEGNEFIMNDLQWLWECVKVGVVTLPEAIALIAWLKHLSDKKKKLEEREENQR